MTELEIHKLTADGVSEDEVAEVIEDRLTTIVRTLLSNTSHVSSTEEAHLVLRSALKRAPNGLGYTNSLLETVDEGALVRQSI